MISCTTLVLKTEVLETGWLLKFKQHPKFIIFVLTGSGFFFSITLAWLSLHHLFMNYQK